MENATIEISLVDMAREFALKCRPLSYWRDLGYSWSDYCHAMDYYLSCYFS